MKKLMVLLCCLIISFIIHASENKVVNITGHRQSTPASFNDSTIPLTVFTCVAAPLLVAAMSEGITIVGNSLKKKSWGEKGTSFIKKEWNAFNNTKQKNDPIDQRIDDAFNLLKNHIKDPKKDEVEKVFQKIAVGSAIVAAAASADNRNSNITKPAVVISAASIIGQGLYKIYKIAY